VVISVSAWRRSAKLPYSPYPWIWAVAKSAGPVTCVILFVGTRAVLTLEPLCLGFRPYAKRSRASAPSSKDTNIPIAPIHPIGTQGVQTAPQHVSSGIANPFLHSHPPNASGEVGSIDISNVELWSYGKSFDYTDLAQDLSASWAGEFSGLFPKGSNIPSPTLATEKNDIEVRSPDFDKLPAAVPDAVTSRDRETLPVTQRMEVARMSGLQASLPQDLSLHLRWITQLCSAKSF
jgi:hypothetical protein